jgi:hypothetical protein
MDVTQLPSLLDLVCAIVGRVVDIVSQFTGGTYEIDCGKIPLLGALVLPLHLFRMDPNEFAAATETRISFRDTYEYFIAILI